MKNGKRLLGLLLAALLVFSMVACGERGNENALVVGFDAEFPPFGFVAADGSYDGFDLAMAKEICNRLGWEYKPVAIDWTAKDNELKSGNINCIWNGFTCTGRENDYTWSDPYVENKIVVVVKKESGIRSLSDLAGKKLMVQRASSGSDAIHDEENETSVALKASLKEIIELDTYNLGFAELAQGTVDGVAVDLGVAKYQIANSTGNFEILDEPISVEQYAVGFYKGNTELRDTINAELKKLAEDGTMLKIAQDYVNDGLELGSLCMIQQ